MTDELPTAELPAVPPDRRPAWMPVISDLALDPGLRSMSCRFLVPHDLPILDGHFPGVPIVPGIMQVGWAVELARRHALVTGNCRGIVTAKFRRLMLPGMSIDASLEIRSGAGKLQFSFKAGDTVVSTGRLQFGVGDE
jgi:3-hydroxymyristoyl/3-hydroxydecanoyl-(acyl carrier protein) dehydratase